VTALSKLYQNCVVGQYGPFLRSAKYWTWLLDRRGFDELIVALEGQQDAPDDGGETSSKLLGYYATRSGRIVEMMACTHRSQPACELLLFAFRDAKEHNRQQVELEAPWGSQCCSFLQKLLGEKMPAGHPGDSSVMAKLLDPASFLTSMLPELSFRFLQSGRAPGASLGLRIEGHPFTCRLEESQVRILRNSRADCWVNLSQHQATRLFLIGQRPSDDGLKSREKPEDVGAGLVRELLQDLFPPIGFWRSVLDDLKSRE